MSRFLCIGKIITKTIPPHFLYKNTIKERAFGFWKNQGEKK